jgi:hypothetical protein
LRLSVRHRLHHNPAAHEGKAGPKLELPAALIGLQLLPLPARSEVPCRAVELYPSLMGTRSTALEWAADWPAETEDCAAEIQAGRAVLAA